MDKETIRNVQKYIEDNINEKLTLSLISKKFGYSSYYLSRLFKRVLGINIFDYIRKIRLTESARTLRDDSNVRILDVALDFYFDTHEGFTRAFSKEFHILPKTYQKQPIPVKYFIPYLIETNEGKNEVMENKTIFVQVIERPKRKAIILRGKTATEYFAYSNEVGCDVWGILSSIKEAINEPIGMWLSDKLRKENTSLYVQGVEVSDDYNGIIPEGFELIDLPKTKAIIFQGEPYNDEQFRNEVSSAMKSIHKYDPRNYGFEYDLDGYRFQYEPQGHRGYIEGRTVKEISL
jgi:AraC-like DNA-binding protein